MAVLSSSSKESPKTTWSEDGDTTRSYLRGLLFGNVNSQLHTLRHPVSKTNSMNYSTMNGAHRYHLPSLSWSAVRHLLSQNSRRGKSMGAGACKIPADLFLIMLQNRSLDFIPWSGVAAVRPFVWRSLPQIQNTKNPRSHFDVAERLLVSESTSPIRMVRLCRESLRNH